MDHADMFRKVGQLKQDIHEFVNEFRPLINWKNDGTDSLLDIGCAGGDVTVDILKPLLPDNFSRIVGVDISETMVKYAQKNFDMPRVSFDVLDISGDVSEFQRKYNSFDHIHSSATLNMIPDQSAAIKNIYKLLKPNGDCILYILVESLFLEAFRKLDKLKWGEWMQDIDALISPYSQRHFPKTMLKKHLANAGFSKWVIEDRHAIPVYENIEIFKETCRPILKFYVQVPIEKEDEFLEELASIFLAFKSSNTYFPWNDAKYIQNLDETENKPDILAPYKILVAYARK